MRKLSMARRNSSGRWEVVMAAATRGPAWWGGDLANGWMVAEAGELGKRTA